MDERSPRQPDSSGPPEQSDETPVGDSRPENPYRIPRRPQPPSPAESGGFGYEHPRPADPASSGEPEPAAPAQPWEPQRGRHGHPEEDDSFERSASTWDNPYRESADRDSPPAGAASSGWDSPRHGEPSAQPWSAADADARPRDPWDAPSAETPAPSARDTPSDPDRPRSWDAPAGGSPAPDAGDNPPGGEPSTESWSDTARTWSAADADARPRDSWDAPSGETPAPDAWDAPSGRTPSDESWNPPVADARPDDSWDTPYPAAQGPSGDWNASREPSGPQPAHDSWQEPQAESGPGPDGRGGTWGDDPYRSPGEPGRETRPAAQGAPDDRYDGWDDDPYRGQPVHQGDTPYPGSEPHRDDAENRAAAGPASGQGFEYLYNGGSGPGGPEGPEGPDDAYDPGPPPPRKSRRGLLIGIVSAVVVLALVGGGVSWYVLTMPQPEEATAEYQASWEAQDHERLAAVTRGDDAAEILGGIDAGLGVDSIEVEVGTPTTDGGTGSAPYEVTMSLTNADDWGWEGELPLIREDGAWWIDFSPEVAYPGLGEGQVLARTAVWGERGQVLAADGTPLEGAAISGSLQMIAGSLGEATEEDLERLGPAYSVGDTVGLGGLQLTYEEQLAGEAATTILMVDAAQAEDPASLEATEENTVATLDGSDGQDITTSIDMGIQNAASSAIIDSDDPAGLVAVRPSTGEILAAVNVPGGFNRAFEGQYPPGSSFKIVTYSALLDNGMGMDASLDCPEEYDLGGWPFRNAGGAEYGAQSVTEAFATSCNTALVERVGAQLSGETLQASAEQFGMNAPLDIGVPAFEPSFPPVDSSTMLGAQSIGQGQILTSPLHMATVPAAVADGSWRHPVLVTEPAATELPEPRPIANAEALRGMMRAVVTDGTAENVPFQGEVFGKTGTAEYGTAEDADENDELPSHAWMVGYKGDVAFAVVVDGGGGGSAVAAPLAAAFTNAL
ncbi:penicillin-binding transpeptidase domain-containing protein [Nocardiopsis sp. NPDC055824]